LINLWILFLDDYQHKMVFQPSLDIVDMIVGGAQQFLTNIDPSQLVKLSDEILGMPEMQEALSVCDNIYSENIKLGEKLEQCDSQFSDSMLKLDECSDNIEDRNKAIIEFAELLQSMVK
jgi:hypothetical protein